MSSHRSPSRSPDRSHLPQTRSLFPSPSKISEALEKPIHYESPSKYDIDFYQRKVNRLEGQLIHRQDELNLMRFRLQKAEDFEIKYQLLTKQNQQLVLENQKLSKEISNKNRDYQQARAKIQQLELTLNGRQNELLSARNEIQNARKRQEQIIQKTSNSNQSDRTKAQEQFLRQLEQLKSSHKDIESKLSRQVSSLKDQISQKIINQQANSSRLNKMKTDKDNQIKRLRDLVKSLQTEVTNLRQACNEKVSEVRKQNREHEEQRNQELMTMTETSKKLLAKQIDHLKDTIRVKNQQISQLMESESLFVKQHENIVNELQAEIKHLQDKIFQLHRDHEIELFNTIQKLQKEHNNDLLTAKQEFKRIQNQYEDRIRDLNDQIRKHKQQKGILEQSLRNAQDTAHKVSEDRERIVSQLSQKIIQMEGMKDEEVKNLTTSMRMIEEQAEIKLKDLHDAILNKNSQFQIMNKQIELKNTEISHLLDEINKLRTQNRKRLQHLDDVYAKEQNLLNQTLNQMKRINAQLKRELVDTKNQLQDKEKQFALQKDLIRDELNLEKQNNTRLNAKNEMLRTYIKELQDDLKQERNQNVDVIQDTNVTRRQILQQRQKVKGQLSIIKDKELNQMRNIFNIDLKKLQNQNNNLLHKLRDKNDQYEKLLKDFKDLQEKHADKVGIKLSRAEDIAKRQATLQAEINLTRNIVKAINLKKSQSQQIQ